MNNKATMDKKFEKITIVKSFPNIISKMNDDDDGDLPGPPVSRNNKPVLGNFSTNTKHKLFQKIKT